MSKLRNRISRPGSQFTSAARVLCGLDPMTYPLSVPRRLADITLPCGPVVRINWHLQSALRSRDERSISSARSRDDGSMVRMNDLELMGDFEDEKRLSLIMISFSFWATLTWRFMCPRGSLAPLGFCLFFLFLLRSYISPQKFSQYHRDCKHKKPLNTKEKKQPYAHKNISRNCRNTSESMLNQEICILQEKKDVLNQTNKTLFYKQNIITATFNILMFCA